MGKQGFRQKEEKSKGLVVEMLEKYKEQAPEERNMEEGHPGVMGMYPSHGGVKVWGDGLVSDCNGLIFYSEGEGD